MDVNLPEVMREHRLTDTLVGNKENSSNVELPIDMRFNQGHVVSIVVYSILMVVGSIGNFTVLSLLLRRSTPKTRINSMLVHLAIADLMVIFIMMPIDIGWAWNVEWKAGDAACRILAFMRTFGLYLSGFVLICISIDRYCAVLKPLQLRGIEKRGRLLLTMAWLASVVCSAPQAYVFHVEIHPNITWYRQCVTFNTFKNPTHELLYSLLNMFFMYGGPLIMFIFCYSSIIMEIIRRSDVNDNMRRSSIGFLGRARTRTLKMTLTIICVFFVCWTPYYIMCLWYWFDIESAKQVDQRIQKGLFLFASTNSCMNPMVYGIFNVRARTQVRWHARQTTSNGAQINANPSLHPPMQHDTRLSSISISLKTME